MSLLQKEYFKIHGISRFWVCPCLFFSEDLKSDPRELHHRLVSRGAQNGHGKGSQGIVPGDGLALAQSRACHPPF